MAALAYSKPKEAAVVHGSSSLMRCAASSRGQDGPIAAAKPGEAYVVATLLNLRLASMTSAPWLPTLLIDVLTVTSACRTPTKDIGKPNGPPNRDESPATSILQFD
jgi:hypothetical protein